MGGLGGTGGTGGLGGGGLGGGGLGLRTMYCPWPENGGVTHVYTMVKFVLPESNARRR